MTPEAQRIAIAEACGWTRLREGKLTGGLVGQPPKGEIEDFGTVPNYLNDLNAMHEAIMAQPQKIRDSINQVLMESLRPNDSHILDRTINATAAQRAEAFLITIGKWDDSK